MRLRVVAGALCALGAALALALSGSPAGAQEPRCDFLTGGGYIIPFGAKGNFGVAGGCKHGSPPAPYWGHLQFKDHGLDVNVHWTSITAYMIDTVFFPDPKARLICGTGRTKEGPVTFIVRAKEGDPGADDEFDISVAGARFYSSFAGAPHMLIGGKIQLHKPNNSNTGMFGGDCPGLPEPPPQGADVSVIKSTDTPVIVEEVRFQLDVHNAGPDAAANVMLHDDLPTGASGTLSWTIDPAVPGCAISDGHILDCTFASMAVLEDITIQVKATPTLDDCPDALVNFATVSADNDPQPANNTSGTVVIAACLE